MAQSWENANSFERNKPKGKLILWPSLLVKTSETQYLPRPEHGYWCECGPRGQAGHAASNRAWHYHPCGTGFTGKRCVSMVKLWRLCQCFRRPLRPRTRPGFSKMPWCTTLKLNPELQWILQGVGDAIIMRSLPSKGTGMGWSWSQRDTTYSVGSKAGKMRVGVCSS